MNYIIISRYYVLIFFCSIGGIVSRHIHMSVLYNSFLRKKEKTKKVYNINKKIGREA